MTPDAVVAVIDDLGGRIMAKPGRQKGPPIARESAQGTFR